MLALVLAGDAEAQVGSFPGTAAATLCAQADVACSSLANGDLLVYDASSGAVWRNKVMTGDCSITAAGAIDCTAVSWTALTDYPSACTNQCITALTDTPTCSSITTSFITDGTITRADIDETQVSIQEHATDCTSLTCDAASAGELCWERDADTLYECEDDGSPAWVGVSGAGGGNSFETIDTSSGTDPVADSATDTLVLSGTSPVVVTGTAGTDTVVISLTQNAGTDVTADLEEEGVTCTDCISGSKVSVDATLESEIEAVADLQDLQGAVTDAQVPNNITIDSASAVEGTDLGTLTDGRICTYDLTGTEIDCDTVAAGDITDVMNCASGDCADIVAGATDSIDFTAIDANAAGEGLILPQTTTCGGSGQASGSTCYQTTGDAFCIWDGSAWDCQTLGVTQVTDTGPGPDCSGTSTYQDGEAGCDTVGGDATGGLDVLDVTEADAIDSDDDGTKELRADGTFIYLDPNDSGSGTPEILIYKTGANGGNMTLLDNDTDPLEQVARWHTSCTTTTSGAEDCDVFLTGYEDGAEVAILTYDADAGMTYGAATVNSHTFTSDGTGTGEFVIPNDGITLTTETDGVYVAQVADGTGIDGTANAEGATYTPTLDLTEITCGDNVTCAATEIDWDGMQMSNAGTDQGVFNGLEFGSDFSVAKDLACVGGTEPGTICTTNTDCAGSGTCTTDKRLTVTPGATIYKQGTTIQTSDLPMAAVGKSATFTGSCWDGSNGQVSTTLQYVNAHGNNAASATFCGNTSSTNAVAAPAPAPFDCTIVAISCSVTTTLASDEAVTCALADGTGTTGNTSCTIGNSSATCNTNAGTHNVDALDDLRFTLQCTGAGCSTAAGGKWSMTAVCQER